jgi:hypothetical protein
MNRRAGQPEADGDAMKKETSRRTYYIEEKDGRYYVYYLQYAPVQTLFEVAHTRDEAEQAIKDHKDGKHSTQEKAA